MAIPQQRNMPQHQLVWVKRAYAFFIKMEETGTSFSIEDIQKATEYSRGTTREYIRNKWWWFLQENSDKSYNCKGLYCSEERFIRLQHSPPAKIVESEIIQEPKTLEVIQQSVTSETSFDVPKFVRDWILSLTTMEEALEISKLIVGKTVRLGMPMAAVFNEIEGRPY